MSQKPGKHLLMQNMKPRRDSIEDDTLLMRTVRTARPTSSTQRELEPSWAMAPAKIGRPNHCYIDKEEGNEVPSEVPRR